MIKEGMIKKTIVAIILFIAAMGLGCNYCLSAEDVEFECDLYYLRVPEGVVNDIMTDEEIMRLGAMAYASPALSGERILQYIQHYIPKLIQFIEYKNKDGR